MTAVELLLVHDAEQADFVAMLGDYLRELDAYELPWDPAPVPEDYARAFEDDPGGQRIEWMVADGERAGFLISRVVPDWPEEHRNVGEVIECYVAPAFRRRGVGRAAVEAWLARQRADGVDLVEASVLSLNTPALAFWERMGFEVRAVQTLRRP
ncbi:MAG: GNAT family N-acetyltransferase [Chloroflexi bacterium]|nr:GNAT family N-acetyltransferase [Chloroflexota bacterium]